MARPYADTDGDISEQANKQADKAAGYADAAVDAAKDAAAQAADRVSALAKDAIKDPEQFARDSYGSIARYTREKPLEALAIAAGVAFVVGALWKR